MIPKASSFSSKMRLHCVFMVPLKCTPFRCLVREAGLGKLTIATRKEFIADKDTRHLEESYWRCSQPSLFAPVVKKKYVLLIVILVSSLVQQAGRLCCRTLGYPSVFKALAWSTWQMLCRRPNHIASADLTIKLGWLKSHGVCRLRIAWHSGKVPTWA